MVTVRMRLDVFFILTGVQLSAVQLSDTYVQCAKRPRHDLFVQYVLCPPPPPPVAPPMIMGIRCYTPFNFVRA